MVFLRWREQKMTNVKYGKNKVIFEQGTTDACMYDIVSGSVAIYSDYGTAAEKELVVLKEGDTFGELAMIENKPRSATAVARERTCVNIIKMNEFSDYFQDKPEKVMKILRNTSHRMRALTREYLDVCDAISAYVKCEDAGLEIDADLMRRLKKISAASKK